MCLVSLAISCILFCVHGVCSGEFEVKTQIEHQHQQQMKITDSYNKADIETPYAHGNFKRLHKLLQRSKSGEFV